MDTQAVPLMYKPLQYCVIQHPLPICVAVVCCLCSQVYANDLNPESARYLNLNIQLNKVTQQVTPFNMDGREFVKLILSTPGGPVEQLPPLQENPNPATQNPAAAAEPHHHQQQQEVQPAQEPSSQHQQQQPGQQQEALKAPRRKQQQKRKLVAEVPPSIPPGFRPPAGGVLFQHAVMNLPASAVEFLDAFNGAFDPVAWEGRQLPWVHVYTFQKNETQEGAVYAGRPSLNPAFMHKSCVTAVCVA
jgi:tRNA (guanine37-N1)-methyltransferase